MSGSDSSDRDDGGKLGKELRRHERTPVTLIVDYDGAEDFLSDYTENLSTGGTFIHTKRLLEPGSQIQLVLSFPGLLERIAIAAVVRWTRTDEPGVGVEFIEGSGRDHLAAFVERVQARDPRTVIRVVRLLVVEDNPHVSDLICNGLIASARRTFGDRIMFAFSTATDGSRAVEVLRAETFDAAIIDVYLPGMDGLRVIGLARRELALGSLPIIAVSAGGVTAREAALAAGADTFLDKPMRLRQLIDTLSQLIKL